MKMVLNYAISTNKKKWPQLTILCARLNIVLPNGGVIPLRTGRYFNFQITYEIPIIACCLI